MISQRFIDIRQYLIEKGVNFKETGDELIAQCFFAGCQDGQRKKKTLYFNVQTTQYICRKCGEKGNIITLSIFFRDNINDLLAPALSRKTNIVEKNKNLQVLENALNKWLLIKDEGLVKVLVGTVIANKLQSDPVWLFIVAPSGGCKTELIRGLNKVKDIYSISDITPQTFLSGDRKNKNASLLLRLSHGTILTYKDFTTVLTMHRDKRHAILSQLREIYDGYYQKAFGTGETKTWQGKIGFIAGVTSVIDNYQSIFQVLGERFIQYRPEQPDAIELAKKAIANCGGENTMREEIQNAFAEFISNVEIPRDQQTLVNQQIRKQIAYLSTFCVKARSGIIREGYSSRQIELIPDPEMPTRLAKQLTTLFSAFVLIDSGQIQENYKLIYKIGMDILPQKRRKVIETLLLADTEMETYPIAISIGYPPNTTRRILEDLQGLGLITRKQAGKGYKDKWQISDFAKNTLEMARPKSHNLSKNNSLPGGFKSCSNNQPGVSEKTPRFFSSISDASLPYSGKGVPEMLHSKNEEPPNKTVNNSDKRKP